MRKHWRLDDGCWRCKRCRKRFGLFTDTLLARESFELPEILELLYWFELGLTDHTIAERVEVSYDRVHRFYLKLGRAIRDFEERSFRLLDGEVEVDETYFGASFDNRRAGERARLRKAGKVKRGPAAKELQQPVFGIYERADGIVYVDLVPDTSGAEFKAVLRENEYVEGSASINGIEGYWAYAKERLLRPHGVADEHLLLYLKETEYRFNHRDLDQEEFVQHLLSEVLLS